MMDEVVIHKNGRLKARCIASYSRKFLKCLIRITDTVAMILLST